jgi:hypothetical protein
MLQPTDDVRRFDSACLGKQKFPTEESVSAVIVLIRRGRMGVRKRSDHVDLLQPYYCDFCGQYHMGHG